jgi:slime mold repeat-containing protein
VPPTCDDGDPCTIDTCDPILGCLYVPLPDPLVAWCRANAIQPAVVATLSLLDVTPARDLGGRVGKAQIRRPLRRAGHLIGRLHDPPGRASASFDIPPFLRVGRLIVAQITRFEQRGQVGVASGEITPVLAARLRAPFGALAPPRSGPLPLHVEVPAP